MLNILLIALGGALGSVSRYLTLHLTIHSLRGYNFPWSTILVNVLGSLFAGILYYFVIKNFDNFDPKLKNFLMVGFLGGYTTFSAFCLDFFRLTQAGQIAMACVYAITSVIISILALFFGFYLMKIIFA